MTTTTTEAPGTNAAIARKIARAESALAAAIERLERAVADLRNGRGVAQPGVILREAAEVEIRRGVLLGLRDAAET